MINSLVESGQRTAKGHFVRKHYSWSPENWDDGFVDNRGRFRVYRPDCPSAFEDGYALRAHVVWWLKHGERHPKNTELHHKDEVKLNDRIENLEPLTRSEHRKRHRQMVLAWTDCVQCGKHFSYPAWRDKDRVTKYCSRDCLYNAPKSAETRMRISSSNTGKKRSEESRARMKAAQITRRAKETYAQ